MKMYAVTVRAQDPAGIVIQAATHGWGKHSFVMFEHEDGYREYFESCWKKDSATGKTGVRCSEWANFIEWADAKKSRQYRLQEITIEQPNIHAAYRFCIKSVGKLGYAKVQLIQNLAHWYPLNGSTTKVTCCEFVTLVLYIADRAKVCAFILRNAYRTVEMTAPSGKEFGIMEQIALMYNAEAVTRGN